MRVATPKTSFSFFIRGLVYKERAKPAYNKRIMYTPKATRNWEEEIAWLAKDAMLRNKVVAPFVGAVKVEILAYCTNPLAKPDADNISKVILDGLNKIAYKDDRQVIDLYIKKAETTDWHKIRLPKQYSSTSNTRTAIDKGEGVFVLVEEVQ